MRKGRASIFLTVYFLGHFHISGFSHWAIAFFGQGTVGSYRRDLTKNCSRVLLNSLAINFLSKETGKFLEKVKKSENILQNPFVFDRFLLSLCKLRN